MSTGALLFLAGSWTVVLGLTAWAFRRILHPAGAAGAGANHADDDSPSINNPGSGEVIR